MEQTNQLAVTLPSSEGRKDKKYINWLNVIACLAVLYLHFNCTFWTFDKSFRWISANFIEAFFNFAVPVFFMCSGATLMTYRQHYDTKTFFKKRFLKTVVPFIFWTIFFFLYRFFVLKDISVTDARSIVNMFVNTQVNDFYWFFIPLFTCYLAIPIYSLIIDHPKARSIMKYTVIVGFVTGLLLPFIFAAAGLHYNTFLMPLVGGGYFLYVIIGYYIDTYPISKRTRIIAYVMGGLAFSAQFLGTLFLSYQKGAIVSLLRDALNVPVFFQSIALFLLIKNINFAAVPDKINKFIKLLSGATFGIYLTHRLIIYHTVVPYASLRESIWLRLFFPIAVFLGLSCVLLLLKKIKFIKYILP